MMRMQTLCTTWAGVTRGTAPFLAPVSRAFSRVLYATSAEQEGRVLYRLMRMDDNGNVALIRKFKWEDEATKELQILEDRAHKQTYFIEREEVASQSAIAPPRPTQGLPKAQ